MKMTGLKGILGDSVGPHSSFHTSLYVSSYYYSSGGFFDLSFEFYFTGVVARAKGIYERMGR